SFTGNGGTGTSNNHGVQIHSTSLIASGALTVTGEANAGTSGTLNCGVYISNLSTLNGSVGLGSLITGIGGGGTDKNHGIFMTKDTSTNLLTGNYVGTEGDPGAPNSLDRTGGHALFA
ncbi:MAG: hypothetical protein JNK37_14765, partial [Verrucomicrobiales bacterium]|nr:hypothetical protein [Verrucomicrobiales bacterium]